MATNITNQVINCSTCAWNDHLLEALRLLVLVSVSNVTTRLKFNLMVCKDI